MCGRHRTLSGCFHLSVLEERGTCRGDWFRCHHILYAAEIKSLAVRGWVAVTHPSCSSFNHSVLSVCACGDRSPQFSRSPAGAASQLRVASRNEPSSLPQMSSSCHVTRLVCRFIERAPFGEDASASDPL